MHQQKFLDMVRLMNQLNVIGYQRRLHLNDGSIQNQNPNSNQVLRSHKRIN